MVIFIDEEKLPQRVMELECKVTEGARAKVELREILIALLRAEVALAEHGCHQGYRVEDYYAPDRYYPESGILGSYIKNFRIRKDSGELFLKLIRPLPFKIKGKFCGYRVKYLYSRHYLT